MRIIVLNDGETYTTIDGCLALEVPDNLDDWQINEIFRAVKEDPAFSVGELQITDGPADALVAAHVDVIARF